MIAEILGLVLALLAVTAGAELLIRGSTALALRAGVSSLFIGLTVVGFGTSSPELGASLTASLSGSADISVANVLGSNLFNICVILGLTAALRPIRVHLRAIRRDLAVAMGITLVPFLALLEGGGIGRAWGATLLVALVTYVSLSYRAARRSSRQEQELAEEQISSTLALSGTELRRPPIVRSVLLVLLGLALLILGSRMFVHDAIDLARRWGVSELIIGLTIVSAGTSLPELLTSAVAARRGNPDIALGNVIGSNIFNMLGILGTCAVVRPLAVHPHLLRLDAPFLVLATAALLPIMRSGGEISRGEGLVLCGTYAAYLAVLVLRGG